MPDPNKCPKCGGFKKPDFDLCFNCGQANRGNHPGRGGSGGYSGSSGGGGGGGYPPKPQATVPKDCIYDTFYQADGKNLKLALFFESAEQLAQIFGDERMSQSSIRSLFNMLKSVEQRIKVEQDKISDAEVQVKFSEFARQCEYQNGRKVIPAVFLQFVRAHTDTALKNKQEFCGFVEYLTSIMARMKSRSS